MRGVARLFQIPAEVDEAAAGAGGQDGIGQSMEFGFDEGAAKLAWQRTLEFFNRNLRS